jgi:hypothetical protein
VRGSRGCPQKDITAPKGTSPAAVGAEVDLKLEPRLREGGEDHLSMCLV